MQDRTRHVIVTGGTGALGQAVVKQALDRGDSCHVTWVLERELERFPYGEDVQLHHVDLADESAVTALYAGLPALDASIHIAGGFAMAPIEKTKADEMTRMFTLNAVTCMLCCREAIKRFRADGVAGRIVNVGARPAVEPVGGMTAYAVSKAAVTTLTQSLAAEVRDDGILVNAILPSIMDTPANRSAMPDADHDAWPGTDEVAATIHFLAGPSNTLTSGALVPVYGRA
jgi:NAD(P)-dependent dehydrogenase (short-subunit alcohol dehydrogenase family)